MPALAITLTLDPTIPVPGLDSSIRDSVAFVSSLLLGSDQQVRNWFSGFIRGRQKVSNFNINRECIFNVDNLISK